MANQQNIASVCAEAGRAFAGLSEMGHVARAGLLDGLAAALDARRDEILRTCSDETALTIEELTPEFVRMTGTLRMFAELVREGSWVRAAVDRPWHGHPAHEARAGAAPVSVPPNARTSLSTGGTPVSPPLIGPNHDIRSMLVPLGPVAVFGSSNFPLAYGVCGGDTASALAAGCPVVVKEHPAHPKTGRLLAEIAHAAASAAGFAGQIVGYVHNEDPRDYSVAEALVGHSVVAAVGFTGSTRGGLALEKLARERTVPVPVFAEMGSLNCVFVWPAAFAKRGEAIAGELAASVLSRVGQQCTKPGAVFVVGNNEHWALHKMIADRMLAAAPRRMLARTVADNYYRRLDVVAASEGVLEATPLPTESQRAAMLGVPCVIAAADTAMEDAPEAWEEIFGPAIVVARTFGTAQFNIPGALTATIFAEPEDIDGSFVHPDGGHWGEFAEWFEHVRRRAGRVIFNGVPTGVRVATAMVHGGPFSATNRPDTTAVGPRAIERWCRPVCWQNCPDGLLPEELRDANPRGVMRVVDGVYTRDRVVRPG